MTSTTFTPTAATVASAEQHAAEADRNAAHAEANIAVIRQRIASADSARAEIAARRNAGEHHHDDAGNLALIGLDREGLVALLAEAEVSAAPLRAARDQARRELDQARHHHQHAQDAAALGALTAHADRLAELLAFTLGAIDEVAQRTGQSGRHAWKPTRHFYEGVRRQASLAGLL
jgi:chromosome segregation ATPase